MSASGLSLYRNSTSDLSLLSTRSRSNRGRRSTSGQGRFCCSLRLAREAEPSPPPADFLFANPVGGAAAVAPSTASYGVASTSAGSHQEGDGSRPCARARISAVHFIRWRYGAARRAGFLLALAVAVELGGQDRRRPLAPGGSRAPKIASALNLHPKGPALITFVHYARARGGAEPAAGRFSFCESGWRRSRSVRRRRRAQRATGSTSPPAACTGKLMGLGRVLAPRFQPCPLSVGGTAPRAALDYFLALAARSYGVRIAAGGSHQEGLALRKSRVH